MRTFARVACSLVWIFCVFAPTARAAEPGPAWGKRGMVVTSVGPAAAAGREILGRGGNAVDAAIATAFAAGVAHQYSSGIGGGGFALVYMAESGEVTALDARETAPASASEALYLDGSGKPIQGATRVGPRAVAVPGLVQGLFELHQRYGSLEWRELVKPAIRLCRDGTEIAPAERRMLTMVEPRLADFAETARIQLDRGQVPPLGWRLVQPDLARTLEEIGARGGGALAYGPIARKIVEATGGALSLEDLAGYAPIWRKPVRGTYRGLEVVSMPPPSSGGVLLVEMLNALEPYDVASLGLNSSEMVNLVSGAMKLAFADRAEYLGDPGFSAVPTDYLVSEAYGNELSALLRPPFFLLRAPWNWGKPAIPTTRRQALAPPSDGGTTQISVVDEQGNAVSLTQTVNTLFGSLITVPGTGIVLNNEMDDFSLPNAANAWGAVGQSANSIQAHKRPLSSMAPTIVLENGRVRFVVGSPMGTFIITAVLQSLLNSVDFKLGPEQAVSMPRFHHQWSPDTLMVEPAHPRDVLEKLRSWGHTVEPSRFPMGAVQLIERDAQNDTWLGATDPRRDGAALGY
ncbi:MAG: gamma-glutamyltransferase [Myxococcota bacterium]